MRFSFFLLTALFYLQSTAQKLSENSVVKDSSGTVYPFAIWQALLMKGDYSLRPETKNDPGTAFILVRLSEEEKEARMTKMPPPRESGAFRKGEKFSLGKLTDMNGNRLDLKNNAGKITVVNFWFINCGPCRMEMPNLNALVEKYASDSVRFVAIALDEKAALEEFLKTTTFKYTIIDGGRYLASNGGVRAYPTHVVVDQEGKVYFQTMGLSPNTVYWIEKSIKELQAKVAITASSK